MSREDAIRKQLIHLLRKSEAHAGFEKAVRSFPLEKTGVRPDGSPHSGWELLEHIRISQRDILDFSKSEASKSLNWPDDYWPKSAAPKNAAEWSQSVAAVLADREEFIRLLEDPQRDLLEKFPWGDGQTLLRQALLIADHVAYHVGEIVLLRRLLGIWS